MAKSSKFDAAEYLDSPEAIAEYLSEAFETGDAKFIAVALGTVARAKGMSTVAKETGLSREGLYKSLSSQGTPELGTAMKVLDSFDMQLIVKPKAREKKAA
jgi:probable addiction module antidote protein